LFAQDIPMLLNNSMQSSAISFVFNWLKFGGD